MCEYVDPCDGVECSEGQVCQVDTDPRRPVCRCGGNGPGGLCPMAYLPVCASDGHTYSNECLMRVSECQRRRTDVRPMFRGECSAGTSCTFTHKFFLHICTQNWTLFNVRNMWRLKHAAEIIFYAVYQKVDHLHFYENFRKYAPIFVICSLFCNFPVRAWYVL